MDWWPRRGEVFYGHRVDDQRELYGVITDDEWNVRNDYATCAFITSRFKQWRDRWQIPISSGGYAITGDIEPFRYVELDQRNRHPSVRTLTRDDLQAFANGLVLTLELWAVALRLRASCVSPTGKARARFRQQSPGPPRPGPPATRRASGTAPDQAPETAIGDKGFSI